MRPELTGWKQVIYQIITQHFSSRIFQLEELYRFVEILKPYYPHNEHLAFEMMKLDES